jgi:tetratricopeptide (TPR) repeat protein
MECPVCHAEARGAFCARCGAPLEGAACRQCAAPLVPGARYCVNCGQPVRPAPSSAPWYVAAAATIALVAVVLAAVLRPARSDAPPPPAANGQAGMDGALAAPPLTGTPREQADRLYDRIMRASTAGDSAQVAFFLPMALAAYRGAGPLDADGLYHLSVLEAAAGDYAAARASAEKILETHPDHLLGLAAAARAARSAGAEDDARRLYSRLLEVYDTERARGLPEYADHATILPIYQQEARELLGQ